MTVEKFDKETANAIGNEAYKAAQAVAERHGLSVRHVGGRYTEGSLTERYEFTVANAAALIFERQAPLYGLKPEDLGRTITDDGSTFEIIGMKPGRSAKRIIIRDTATDKRYVADNDYVRDLLAGIDPVEKAEAERKEREVNAATLKAGDYARLTEVRPKYLDRVLVEVTAVDKKTKTAVVRLVDGVWIDQRAKKRFGAAGVITARFDQLSPQKKPEAAPVALQAVK